MSARGQPLRVLFIEDNDDDVALELAALREGGFAVSHEVVETADDVRAALGRETWDVIVSDFRMPELDGLHALGIAKEIAPDTPFILVSGTVGEDVAVDAMRAGAQDYVLKENLTRLASAVQRELREAETRKSGRISQRGLRLLADVGAALGSSLDHGAILGQLPRIVIGDFGDLCIIDLVDEEGTFHRAASAHVDPGREDLLRQLEQGHPPHEPSSEPAGLAMSRRAPVVVDDLDGMRDAGADAAFVRIARALGLTAALTVPLVAQDSVIGAINLARRRPYSPLESQIIEELAGRIAVSIENARLYERAQRAIQLRDEFLSIASHELRTPLTALQLQIEGLHRLARQKRAEWADDRLVSRLERSTQSLDRLGRLVESLLDVSRISTGRLDLDVEALDLGALVRDVTARVRDDAQRAGCELRVTAAGSIAGSWDRLRLEQVLMNVLSNAIKYGAGKPVEIEVAARGDEVVIEVRDHGIGIPPGDLERIFGRFERAVSTRHYGGLGLGLFIARQVVEAHGGAVTARPTPSGGATFTILLPRETAPAASGAREGARGAPAPAHPPASPARRGHLTSPAEAFAFVEEVKDYAIFMLDPEGRVLTWNEGARAIKGYTADEILGQSYTRFYSAEDRAAGKPGVLLRRAATEGRAEDEGWRVRKDGSRFWAGVVITAIHAPGGRLRGFVKVTRDLTERRQAEEMLRQSEERLRLLVESVKDYAIFMLETDGRIATWNAGAAHLTTYRADEVLGEHFSLFYTPEARAAGQPAREIEIATAEGRYEAEGWRVRKDGTRFCASVVLTAVHDAAHRLRGFAEVIRDRTEQRRIEQEARAAAEEAGKQRAQAIEAQKALAMRDEFISVAAHELRTPLTALQLKVQGAASALRKTGASPGNGQVASLAERLDGALRQIERLIEFVERLLDVSRIVRGKLVMKLEHADLTALVGQVVEDFREPALQAGSELRFHATGSVPGTWDRARMEQVVINLLSNAIKYGRGKPIDVRLEATDTIARLVVADHGIGIAAEDIDRIFTRFERAVPVRHYGGLGLGLYVTRNIVEAHGGSIHASSSAGAGSTFLIEIPRQTVLADFTPEDRTESEQ